MITFRHLNLNQTLSWDDNCRLNELVVENAIAMRNISSGLLNGDNNLVSITDNGKSMTSGKEIDLLFNPIKLDFNNRRAMATLLKLLVKTSTSEEFYLPTNEFKTKVVDYLNKLVDTENFIFDVETDDFSLDAIAKAVNMHIVSDDDDYIELLTDYMAMMVELAGIKLFTFVNLRSFITDSELNRLIHNACNHDLSLFLIESKDLGKMSHGDRIIVDADMDEI